MRWLLCWAAFVLRPSLDAFEEHEWSHRICQFCSESLSDCFCKMSVAIWCNQIPSLAFITQDPSRKPRSTAPVRIPTLGLWVFQGETQVQRSLVAMICEAIQVWVVSFVHSLLNLGVAFTGSYTGSEISDDTVPRGGVEGAARKTCSTTFLSRCLLNGNTSWHFWNV